MTVVLIWGNPNIYYAELNEDMISLKGGVGKLEQTVESFGAPNPEKRVKGVKYKDTYTEGPWLHKREGKYYLLYAAGGVPEHIAYSMSGGPLGPWKYMGEIMPLQDTGSFTNHCGVIDYKGNSYFFYHTGKLPGGGGFGRSAAVEQFKYNDNIYYIPYGIMTSGIFYDKDQWAEAGLTEEDIPKTWDQLIAVAQKLTKVDDNGKMTVAGFGFNGNISFLLETLNYEKGLPMFDKEGTPIIDDPIVAENIQFIQKLYDEYKVNDRNFDTAANTFATGESAMIYNWGWLTYSLKSTAPDKNIGYFQTPSFVEGEVCPAYGRNGGDSSLAVSATLKDEAKIEAAFDFLTYLLANDDAVYEFDELLSMYPRKISLRENQEKIDGNVVFKELKNYVDRTVWPGPVPGSYADNNYITYVVDPIFKENADIASTLTSAQKVCSDALAEEGNWFFSERDYQYASEFIK